MSLRPRPVDRAHRKRPSGVSAPPVGKLPSLVSLPTGSSFRPVGWILVFGPTMFNPAAAAQPSPAATKIAAVAIASRAGRLRMARLFQPGTPATTGKRRGVRHDPGPMSPQREPVRIVLLPGDGIGPEIVAAARRLLEALDGFDLAEELVGGASIDAHGTALTDAVLDACRSADAVLLGAVGGPKWDTTDPDAPRPEQGLLGLRKGLGLYANLRPVRPSAALLEASPLRTERIAGTDLLVVRELTGGIYFGERGRAGDRAHDTCEYSVGEIERIARVAFDAAGRRAAGGRRGPLVTSVDKANVLETSRLWRETVERVGGDYADVELEHMLVDNAAMQLVARPARFDVVLTENLFGDILSDESAMLTGSLGMLPSASLGGDGPGLFEPVHGSAPDIAGQGVANPLATFLSVAMMLRHGLAMPDEATAVEAAVDAVLERGLRTPDLAGQDVAAVGTEEITQAVVAELRGA
jgi:3-isopropylmalate dehydrogenase